MKAFRFLFPSFSLFLLITMLSIGFLNTRAYAANDSGSQHSDFCSQVSMVTDNITKRLNSKDLQQTNLQQQIQASRQQFNARLEKERAFWDKRRADQYKALLSRAQTDQQKAAIMQYKNTIETALNNRRVSVDTAISEFRRASDADIASRQGNIDLIATTFKNQVASIMQTAQQDCANGNPGGRVRQTFVDSLHGAQYSLDVALSGVHVISEDLQKLDTIKRNTIENAVQIFQETADQAVQKLKIFVADSSSQPSIPNFSNAL